MKTFKDVPEEADDTIQVYYARISEFPLLKRKEETELFETMQKWSNDKARAGQRTRRNGMLAQEKLINSNLRFVVKISKDYARLGLPLLDLISEGNIGLMKAVERYKLDRGTKFSSYAVFWIKQAIFKALDYKARLIRIPSDSNRQFPKILRWITEQEGTGKEKPTVEEIAEKFSTSKSRVCAILEARKEIISFNSKVGPEEGENSQSFGETIKDLTVVTPDLNVEIQNNKEILNKLLNRLSRREKFILMKRFGINDKDFETLEQLGKRNGVTRERIRQIEEAALKKLKKMVKIEYCIKTKDNKSLAMLRF